MRSPMTKTWTWFHPKPWVRLCAAAPRDRPAPCNDAGAQTQSWPKAWLWFQALTLVPGLRGCFDNTAPLWSCLRTSSSEPNPCLYKTLCTEIAQTHIKARTDIRASLIHCEPKAWPIFLFLFDLFIELHKMITMPSLHTERQSNSFKTFGMSLLTHWRADRCRTLLVNRSAV